MGDIPRFLWILECQCWEGLIRWFVQSLHSTKDKVTQGISTVSEMLADIIIELMGLAVWICYNRRKARAGQVRLQGEKVGTTCYVLSSIDPLVEPSHLDFLHYRPALLGPCVRTVTRAPLRDRSASSCLLQAARKLLGILMCQQLRLSVVVLHILQHFAFRMLCFFYLVLLPC